MIFFNKKKENLKVCAFDKTLIMALIHRLRTPLNSARWLLESIIKDNSIKIEDKKTINESYNKIIESINITNEILNLIGDNRKLDLEKENFDLCFLIDNILKGLKYLVKEKKVTLEYNKCDNSIVFADKETIGLAIENILDNAIRYSPNGKVTILLKKDEGFLKLIVKDTGIGISPERLKNIFDGFMKIEHNIEMEPGRKGIGLYTTRKILEMNNGDIKIDSILDKGTTVEIILPIK